MMKHPAKKLSIIASILLGVASILLIQIRNIRQSTTINEVSTPTAIGQTRFFLEPREVKLTNGQSQVYKLKVTTDQNLAFLATKISFDPSHIQINTDPVLVNSPRFNRIRWPLTTTLNQSGIGEIAVGLVPAAFSQNLTGTFDLATFTVNANSTAQATIALTLSVVDSQAVNKQAQPSTVNAEESQIHLNESTASASPSPSPSSSAATLPGDLNGSGHVDIFDYNLLVSKFGNPYTIYDYNKLVANFGR